MNILEDIDNAQHILIVVEKSFIPSASALYTHILRAHKKVSLVCTCDEKDNSLSFLPWFDKIKSISNNSSADLKINLELSSIDLYNLFKTRDIKPNKKMATALYSGLLKETNGFTNNIFNGIVFAAAKELIDFGAEYKICNNFILKSTTLPLLRLKAIMLKEMILEENASLAVLNISDNILNSCGAKEEDAELIMQEVLNLNLVKKVQLQKSDEENKILKIIKKEL